MKLNQENSISIFTRMLRIRRFEEAVMQLLADGVYDGHCHVYIGQEATGATIAELLREDDLALTTHRNHGHIISRGADPGRGLAEILGRADGFCKGRAGSSNMCARSAGFLSSTSVVGGSLGLGIGAAHALKIAGTGAISVAFFGDGALEEGIAYEALNIAKLYDLPVLFACENNSGGVLGGRATGEWSSSSLAARQLADIPASLNITSKSVDGSDVDAVWGVVSDSISSIRNGDGPVFIEFMTDRWPGSRLFRAQLLTGVTELAGAWDPAHITGEHADWIENSDPVIQFARRLLAEKYMEQDQMIALDQQVREQIDGARKFACESPLLDTESELAGTFA